MAITWRTDYAFRIMYEAARCGGRATVRELAEGATVPYDFARSIARELAQAGLLVSRRGVKGGFELTRPAHEITFRDIFLATSEPMTMSLCTWNPEVCGRTDICPMHNGVWRGLDEKIENHLAGTTLAEAIEIAGGLPANCEVAPAL
jgi:Rrf2 family protein